MKKYVINIFTFIGISLIYSYSLFVNLFFCINLDHKTGYIVILLTFSIWLYFFINSVGFKNYNKFIKAILLITIFVELFAFIFLCKNYHIL